MKASGGCCVAEALRLARQQGVHRLDAQLLLAYLLQRDRTWLTAHDDAPLSAAQAAAYAAGLQRRAGGEPLAYVIGQWPFAGLSLSLTPAVLIPRPETEALVLWAEELLSQQGATAWPEPLVADLGTGSGAIALAVKQRCPWAQVLATDISADALAVARANATRLGLDVAMAQGSWFEPLRGARFHLLLSNPPYVAADDPHLVALQHEPLAALTPTPPRRQEEPAGALGPGVQDASHGPAAVAAAGTAETAEAEATPQGRKREAGSGLVDLLTLAAGASACLHVGGWLLLEHGHDQAAAVTAALAVAGFVDVSTRHDLAGMARLTGGRWPAAARLNVHETSVRA